MASSSLETKTVRPGSLGAYSYYRSARRPDPQPSYIAAKGSRLIPRKLAVVLVLVVAVALVSILRSGGDAKPVAAASDQSHKSAPSSSAPAVVAAPAKSADKCAGNSQDKLVLVSISQRHLWACAGGKAVYDSPVITGMTAYEATTTPPGTYHIYSKQTNTTLTGTDITGSWSDPVQYWMPFLDNQFGTYGFHDATWRSNDEFGNVSPDSSQASHGCVELPLTTSRWLYDWAAVGTAVTIKN